MNGYFQLSIESKGVSLRLVPPTDQGEAIKVNELREYLNQLGISYDAMAINSALYQLKEEEVVLFLSPISIPEVNEKCVIRVSPDRLTAFARFYPPSTGGKDLTYEQVLDIIKAGKIVYGIDESAIMMALEEKMYCKDIIIAKGKLPTVGMDAKINYYFDTNNQARPELKEDGSVDFFKLNTLHHCTQGQVLAEIIPAQKGEDGIDVFGAISKARDVKDVKFDHGQNLQISEDGLKLISMVDGHASLIEGAVFVSDVYEVEDVNTATGNIEYHGTVEVRGNVCENFQIKTDGNVFVNGVVEGAYIEAGGDIIIARGMHGQNKGKLVAGGNIIAKFISSAEVTAGGYVEAEQILNANVTAGTSVHADAGKGLVNGGRILAKSCIKLKNAGSPMGSNTIIEVGCDPAAKKRLAILQKDIAERSKTINQLKTGIASALVKVQGGTKLTTEQLMSFKAWQQSLEEEQKQLNAELQEMQQLDDELKDEGNAHIDIKGTMYQGVNVTISGVNMVVRKEFTFCKLIRKGADVTSTLLS